MKIKQILKKLTLCVLCTFSVCLIQPIYANEISEKTKDEIVEEFNRLQNAIDEQLIIENNYYVFNADDVYQTIINSDFDFDTFNKYFNTDYTSHTFAQDVISRIKDADLTIRYNNTCDVTRGTYCQRNAEESGWNYRRTYYDYKKSNEAADILKQAANDCDLGSYAAGALAILLPGIGSSIATALGVYTVLESWYLSTLADAIISNNKDGNCGTVTDINIFTSVFTVWSQKEFFE